MPMLKIMVCTLATMLGLSGSPVLAEGGTYQIELIVFTQAIPNTEVFEQTASQIKWPSDLTELSAYKRSDTTTLDDSYKALSKNPAYQPVLHIAWIQSVGIEGENAPVHIRNADGKLNGYVQLIEGQGLQMMVDLELTVDPENKSSPTPYPPPEAKPVVYRLNEKRFIKSNEVYYLDHPKFGAVIKISLI